ncbi:hypothetical protein M758_1G244300, partial [Ceratodon purpureus]
MTEVRVSSRVNKGKRIRIGRSGAGVVRIREPVVVNTSQSPVSKKKRNKRDKRGESSKTNSAQAVGSNSTVRRSVEAEVAAVESVPSVTLAASSVPVVATSTVPMPSSEPIEASKEVLLDTSRFGITSDCSLLPSVSPAVRSVIPDMPGFDLFPASQVAEPTVSYSDCEETDESSDDDGYHDLAMPSDAGLSDTAGPSVTGPCSRPSPFFSIDQSLVEKCKDFNKGKSLKNENWARNRLNAWRESVNMELVPIEDMTFSDLAEVRLQFFLCVCKDSGQRYPSGSIRNMHRSFNRIICKAQTKRIAETKVNEIPFDITENPFFIQVNNAVIQSMELSRNAGVNKVRKKPKSITFAEEALLLNHESTQLTFGRGVQKRMLWYSSSRFFIQGNKEMYNLKYKDFTRGVNDVGLPYVEYNERTSKSYGVTLNRCQDEDFRPAVVCYDPDVVKTWQTYDDHLGDDMKDGFLWFTPLDGASGKVWFKRLRCGQNTISKLLSSMADECGIEGEVTNKSGRRTGISRMSI